MVGALKFADTLLEWDRLRKEELQAGEELNYFPFSYYWSGQAAALIAIAAHMCALDSQPISHMWWLLRDMSGERLRQQLSEVRGADRFCELQLDWMPKMGDRYMKTVLGIAYRIAFSYCNRERSSPFGGPSLLSS